MNLDSVVFPKPLTSPPPLSVSHTLYLSISLSHDSAATGLICAFYSLGRSILATAILWCLGFAAFSSLGEKVSQDTTFRTYPLQDTLSGRNLFRTPTFKILGHHLVQDTPFRTPFPNTIFKDTIFRKPFLFRTPQNTPIRTNSKLVPIQTFTLYIIYR